MNSDKLAAIDIGTNSFHLIIAKMEANFSFTIVERLKEIVRLGLSSSDMKYITDEAMNRGIEALRRFKALADMHKATIRAVATSAVREALNKAEFIRRVKSETDIDVEIISGNEEGRLIYHGVLQSLPIYKERVFIIDIGGGSTEFIQGCKGDISFVESLKIGSIRYTQKYFKDNVIGMNSIYDCRADIKGILSPVLKNIKSEEIDHFIGTSGTILNIASIIRDLNGESDYLNLNHYTFSRKELTEVINQLLLKKSVQERAKIDGLDPARADIIVAGALILEQIVSELKIKEITISDYALREGVVLDTIHKLTGTKKFHYINEIRDKSIHSLMERCKCDQKHSKQVTNLALQIFDQSADIHKLGREDREYLESAALLHDIGYYISHTQHHRHSYYLIRNSELLGFSDREIEIMANIGRYHRKSHPKLKHEGFAKLSPDDQERVKRLSAIIRIADGLDRSHKALVMKINIKSSGNLITMNLVHKSDKDISLDIWGTERKKQLFEEVFNCKIKFVY